MKRAISRLAGILPVRKGFFLLGWSVFCFTAGRGAELMWPNEPPWFWWLIATGALVVMLGPLCWDKVLVPWWKSAEPKAKALWTWANENRAVAILALTAVVLSSALVASLATNDRVIGALARLADPGPGRDLQAPLRTRPVCESNCRNAEFRIRECEVSAAVAGGLASRRGLTGDVRAATEYFRGCLIDRDLSWETCEQGEPECRLLRRYSTRHGFSVPSFIEER